MIEGRAYRYETLYLLPRALQLCNVKTRLVGDGLGFQGEASFLSNFFPTTIRIEDEVFSCAEQAYQFFKTRTCKRDDRATKILGLSNPRDIKAAGDDITSTSVWEQHKERFMWSIVFKKFLQNDEIRRKLIDTGEITLYECTRNRWWGSGYKLDSPEWATTKCPGLNKMGSILMEVRAALRKMEYKSDALSKSPGAIIKAFEKIDQDFMAAASDPIPATRERDPDTGSDPTPMNREQDMVFDLPVIQEGGKQEVEPKPTPVRSDVEDTSASTSSVDSDDMMDQTDVEEESVNITATSNTSRASAKAIADVTGQDGKLDISKLRDWSIPKIKDLDPSLHDSFISGRTRGQTTTPAAAGSSNPFPQAQSTPHPSRVNKSHLVDRVRSNMNPV